MPTGTRRRCAECTKQLSTKAGPRARYCSQACRQRAYRAANGLYSQAAGIRRTSRCEQCGTRFEWIQSRDGEGRMYCGSACKQKAYRTRRTEHDRWSQEWREQERREREERQRRQEQERRDEEERRRGQEQARDRSGRRNSHHRIYTVEEARRILYKHAQMTDDQAVPIPKSVYRTALRLTHPDHNPGTGAEAFKEVHEAGAFLKRHGLLHGIV